MSTVQPEFPRHLAGEPLLALAPGSLVLELVRAWFPEAAWEQAPVSTGRVRLRPRQGVVGRFRSAAPEEPTAEPGRLRLVGETRLEGPHPVAAAAAHAGGLPPQAFDVYLVRGGLPPEPVVMAWLAAAARRTGGAVVLPEGGVLVPDPSSALTMTLWSPRAIDDEAALAVLRPALSGSRLTAVETVGSEAWAFTAVYEYDGLVRVSLARSTELPLVLATADPTAFGVFGYRVAWSPPGVDAGELDVSLPLHAIARNRVAPSMTRAVLALEGRAGGTVVDEGGFVIDARDLAERARADRR
jgi:hypothetical protein